MRRIGWLFAAVAVQACGSPKEPRAASPGAPVESTTASGRAATPAAPPFTERARALFLGTSLTAGLGLPDPGTEAWPGVIQRLADSTHLDIEVVNAGLSGETSAGALRRADWLFKQPYDLLVIETGANDGLRGLDPDSTAANIEAIIAKSRSIHPDVQVLLVQMEAPTNLGHRYTAAFHGVFPRVARDARVTLLPFLLDHVGGIAKLNQGDGIHPTPEGARIAARNVWPGLRDAMRATVSRRSAAK